MPLQEWSETTLIAEMNDEPVFSEDFDALTARLEETKDPMPDVIVNLKAVTRLNSSNLAQLLRLRKMVLSRPPAPPDLLGAGHRVVGVPDDGLEKMFEFTDDVTTSLASLQIEQIAWIQLDG